MAITDDQFTVWLAADKPREILYEQNFGYQSSGARAEGTLYFSVRGYKTGSGDTPANQLYASRIRQTPKIVRSIEGRRLRVAAGSVVLDNSDGALDYLLDVILDGYDATFLLGAPEGTPGWSRSDFRTVLVQVAEVVEEATESAIEIRFRDARLRLDREVKGDEVGGDGPDATKALPLLWGHFENIAPLLYDEDENIYAVVSNYGTDSVVHEVRENGLDLRTESLWVPTAGNTTVNAGTDVFTKTSHGLQVNDVIAFRYTLLSTELFAPFTGMDARWYWVNSVPSADTFTLSETRGGSNIDVTDATFTDPTSGVGALKVTRQRWFDDTPNTGRIQLSTTPTGRITLDFTNADDFVSSPFALAKHLIETYGEDDVAVDATAFSDADTALDAKVDSGYYSLAAMDRRNLLDLLDELMEMAFGWIGENNVGTITAGLHDVTGLASASATRSLATSDILTRIVCRNVPPTISSVSINIDVNHTPQPDGLSDALTDEDRARYSAAFATVQKSTAPTGTAYSTNKPLYHRRMVEGAPRTYNLHTQPPHSSAPAKPIGDYANEIVADAAPHLRTIEVDCRLDKYAWKLGEVVEVTYPRFGLDAGVNALIEAISTDLIGERVELLLLTQVAPDHLTASH